MKVAGLLHAALWANATFTTACALTLLAAPAAVGAWVGLDGIAAQVALGAGLLLFVAGLAFLATRPTPPAGWVRAVVFADLLWVGATLLVLVGPWAAAFSERGLWTLVVVAQFVLLCGVLQAVGLRIALASDIGARS